VTVVLYAYRGKEKSWITGRKDNGTTKKPHVRSLVGGKRKREEFGGERSEDEDPGNRESEKGRLKLKISALP